MVNFRPGICIGIVTLAAMVLATDAHAMPITLSFEDLAAGTVLDDQYASLGVRFRGTAVYDLASISNPPLGDFGHFILPSSGYNTNGTWRIDFVDPYTLQPITTPFVSFRASIGSSFDTSDTFTAFWAGPNLSTVRQDFSLGGVQTLTIVEPSGIQSFWVQDWGVNGFDAITFDVTLSSPPSSPPDAVPEPGSALLIGTAALFLSVSRRHLRK